MSSYRIKQIGSLATGCRWRETASSSSHTRAEVLGAWLDATLAGANEYDADNIARATEARPWPTYEERMAVFSPVGPWKPSRDPFKKQSPDARLP
jgi:hypothetical protein